MELILEPPPDAGSDQAYADYVAELLESGFNLPPQDDDADDGDAEGGGAVFSGRRHRSVVQNWRIDFARKNGCHSNAVFPFILGGAGA